jgi:hypothetical protein
MRQLASFLLVALAVPAAVVLAAATDVWRWKDDRGVVHYSDSPVPGAERVTLAVAPPASNATPGSTPPAPAAAPVQPPAPVAFSYAECAVVAPGNEQTFNAVNMITASLQITPSLLEGHSVRVMLDGDPYGAWPARMLTFKIEGLARGTHVLAGQIVDAKKKVICESAPVTFHVRQPSVLAPANRPKPKKP